MHLHLILNNTLSEPNSWNVAWWTVERFDKHKPTAVRDSVGLDYTLFDQLNYFLS